MTKRTFLLIIAIFIIALVVAGFAEQNKVISPPKPSLEKRIASLEAAIAELKAQLAEVSRRVQPTKENSSPPPSEESKPSLGPRAWTEGTQGWQEDGANIWTSNLGYNVGIGTNTPLAPLQLVGDFYNQGFAGVKSNYNPGVSNWSNVAEVTITTHGIGEGNSVVLIYAHVQDYAGMSFYDMFIRVIRGGTLVAIACEGAFGGYMGATLVSFDEPPPGTYTYTLQLESVVAPASGYNFFVIELKR